MPKASSLLVGLLGDEAGGKSSIAKEIISAVKKGDADALESALGEFIDEHAASSEEDEDEEEDEIA